MLRLNETLYILEKKGADLEAVIMSRTAERYQTAAAHDELERACHARNQARFKLAQKERTLGATDKQALRTLMNDQFTTKRLNAQALKERLRQKLI